MSMIFSQSLMLTRVILGWTLLPTPGVFGLRHYCVVFSEGFAKVSVGLNCSSSLSWKVLHGFTVAVSFVRILIIVKLSFFLCLTGFRSVLTEVHRGLTGVSSWLDAVLRYGLLGSWLGWLVVLLHHPCNSVSQVCMSLSWLSPVLPLFPELMFPWVQ